MGDHKEEVIFDHLIIVNDCMALGKKIFIYVVNFLYLSMNIFIVFFRCLVFKSALKLVCYVLQLGIIGKFKKCIAFSRKSKVCIKSESLFHSWRCDLYLHQCPSLVLSRGTLPLKGTVSQDFQPPFIHY